MRRFCPPRLRSGSSFRALGENSPACSNHRSLEDEYNFVRAIVDAMANQTAQSEQNSSSSSNTETQGRFQRPVVDMNNIQNSHEVTVKDTYVPPLNISTIRPSSSDAKMQSIIDIDELLNDRNNPQTLKRKKIAAQLENSSRTGSPTLQRKSYSPRSRKIVFGYQARELMSQRDVVLPATPLSQARLQLTGDVMKIYKTNPQQCGDQRDQSLPQDLVANRSVKDKEATLQTQAMPQSYEEPASGSEWRSVGLHASKPSDDSTIMLTHTDAQSGHLRKGTRLNQPSSPCRQNHYAMPISPPSIDREKPENRLERKSTQQRPKTSYSWKDRGLVPPIPIDTNRPRSVTTKQTPRPPGRSMAAIKPAKIARPPNRKVKPCNPLHMDRNTEVPDIGIEGKTEMSKSTGTLTLSVFLPRENEDSRACKRADHVNETNSFYGDSSGGSRKSTNNNNSSTIHSHGIFDSPDGENLQIVTTPPRQIMNPKTMTSSRSLRKDSSPLSVTRRAIHCEVFGPDLCHDCQLQHERADMRDWQDQTYPDIRTDTKKLVVAPKMMSSTQSPSAPSMYQSLHYGDHSRRMPSIPGFRPNRNLDSSLSQNEIPSRIWPSWASPKQRLAL